MSAFFWFERQKKCYTISVWLLLSLTDQIHDVRYAILHAYIIIFTLFHPKSNGLNSSFVFYFQCGWHFQKYDCAPRFLSPIFHLFSATKNSRGKKVKWNKCDFLSITTPGIQFGECCMYLCANWERHNSDTHALYTVWMALTIFVSREFGSIPRALAVANSSNNDNNNNSSKNEQKWGKKKQQQTELCVQLCWWI